MDSNELIQFSEMSLGQFVIPYTFSDSIVLFDFQNIRLLLLEGTELKELHEDKLVNSGLIFASTDNLNPYLQSNTEFYRPLSLSPLRFDTIHPDVTATKVTDVHICDDILHATTDENYYVLEDEGWVDYWRGGPSFEIDAHCNSYLSGGPGYAMKFNHKNLSYDTFDITFNLPGIMVNFRS